MKRYHCTPTCILPTWSVNLLVHVSITHQQMASADMSRRRPRRLTTLLKLTLWVHNIDNHVTIEFFQRTWGRTNIEINRFRAGLEPLLKTLFPKVFSFFLISFSSNFTIYFSKHFLKNSNFKSLYFYHFKLKWDDFFLNCI